MTGVLLHPDAFRDIDEISEFIARDNPGAAERMVDELRAAAEGLANFPNRGHRRPDFTGRSVRFLLVRAYLIAYVSEARPVWVLAVIHGRRSPQLIGSILKGRN